MSRPRARARLAAALPLLLLLMLARGGDLARAQEPPAAAGTIEVAVEPRQATVGDPLEVTITVTLPAGSSVRAEPLAARLGPFTVETQAWAPSEPLADGGAVWRWSGRLRAFRTGELELPAIAIGIDGAGGERTSLSTQPVAVRIDSVLEPGEVASGELPEIADLKPPASLEPDYRALIIASAVLGALLLVAAILWWLHRRYAAALAAVPIALDEFDRVPPHVWVYAELQKLLERRLAEQGHVDLFFAELSRILKRYLGGRYRVELLEHTTEEVPRLLRQAGCDERAIARTNALLAIADRVKFAGERADPSACRRAIEEAYAIVDATKPREEPATEPATRGAA